MSDERLSSQQAADYVGVSIRTLYREAARGRLTYRKLGGQTVWLRSELDRYLRSLPERGRVA